MMFRQIIVSLMLTTFSIGFLSGCATTKTAEQNLAEGKVQEFDPESPMVKLKDVESFRVTDPDGPKVVDEELEQIPTEINPLVEKWLVYFQGKGRPHMERYLARSTRYMKLMKKILRQNGLPEDLVYIALIESGFSPKATSRAAAVGYWQFIRGTGRRYGLEVSSLIDERRDPVMSTQAAAEYFKGLYSVFGSWYLAMASYNVGENRVKREVMNHYTRDFWELARKKRFPKETVNYIPKFIAAKLIGNNPEKYGFTEIEYMTPIEFEHVTLTKPVNLKTMAAKMGIEYDDLKQLNPKFKGEIAPLAKNSLDLRVPIGQTQQALVAAQQATVDKVEYVAEAGETEIYKVRSGDSLYTIARKYKTTVAWLKDSNDLKNGKKLRIGQRVTVPERGSHKTTVKSVAKVQNIEKMKANKEDVEKAAASPELITAKGVFYIVQPGDTLSAIADDYNSSIEELRRMNKLNRGSVLRAGLKLRVPKDDGLPQEAPESGKAVVINTRVADREPQAVGAAHVVKSGENLSTIAKKYGVSLGALRKANNLSKRSMLKVGSRLTIPGRPSSLEKNSGNKHRNSEHSNSQQVQFEKNQAPSKSLSMRRERKPRVHIVRNGENLSLIAEKYRIPVSALKGENRISRGSKLFVGAKLLIPVASATE